MRKFIFIAVIAISYISCGQNKKVSVEQSLNLNKLITINYQEVCFNGVCLQDSVSKGLKRFGQPDTITYYLMSVKPYLVDSNIREYIYYKRESNEEHKHFFKFREFDNEGVIYEFMNENNDNFLFDKNDLFKINSNMASFEKYYTKNIELQNNKIDEYNKFIKAREEALISEQKESLNHKNDELSHSKIKEKANKDKILKAHDSKEFTFDFTKNSFGYESLRFRYNKNGKLESIGMYYERPMD